MNDRRRGLTRNAFFFPALFCRRCGICTDQVILYLDAQEPGDIFNVFYIAKKSVSTFSIEFEGLTISSITNGEPSLYAYSVQSGAEKVSV